MTFDILHEIHYKLLRKLYNANSRYEIYHGVNLPTQGSYTAVILFILDIQYISGPFYTSNFGRVEFATKTIDNEA
jgi:hypothetical protein